MTTTPPGGTRFLSLAEVGTELNIGLAQTYALVRNGELQGIQISGRNQWRVERAKLEEFIEQTYGRAGRAVADRPEEPPVG